MSQCSMKEGCKTSCEESKMTHLQNENSGPVFPQELSSNGSQEYRSPKKPRKNSQLAKQEEPTNQESVASGFLRIPRRLLKNLLNVSASESRHRFARTLKESLGAFGFNLVGVAAGAIIASFSGLFKLAPWVILVYPSVVSARGVIGGLFCGRLSTALHLGTMQPGFLGNTKSFYLLFRAIVVLTLEASLGMSLFALLFGSAFLGVASSDFVSILMVTVATMALALIVVSPLTIAVSVAAFKRGLDPDIILYPIESTVSDFFITLIYVFVVSMFLQFGMAGKATVTLIALVLVVLSAYCLLRSMKETEFLRTVKESFLTLVFVAFIVNVTGSTLGKISEIVGESREIYTVYPALIDTMGDVGAVVGSTATTKLALGALQPSFSSIRNHATEICGAWFASSIMYFIYAFLSLIIQGQLSQHSLFMFAARVLTTNVIAGAVIVMISYMVAVLTYRKGLDPDNFVIPIESSLADSITTISLFLVLSLFR
jgi:mgtE-like transporter